MSFPASIKPHLFTNLAWDNKDRIEETLSGKGTSHRVNGIAVQPIVFGSNPPPKDLPRIDKRKQRTLSTEHQPQLDVYVAGPRVEPHLLKTKDNYAGEATKAAKKCRAEKHLWILARPTSFPGPFPWLGILGTRLLLGKSIQMTKRCLVGPDLTSNQGSSSSDTRCRRVSPNNKCSSNRINNSV